MSNKGQKKILKFLSNPDKCLKFTLLLSVVIHLAFIVEFRRNREVNQIILKSRKSDVTLINVIVLEKWEKLKPVERKKSPAGEIPHLLDKKKKIKIQRKKQEVKESLSQEVIDAKENYMTKVLRQIHSRKYYPSIARRMRLEGNVKLKFTLDKSGSLMGAAFILEGCKHKILNNAGQATIVRAGPYPPFPPDVASVKEKMTFIVTVEYSLKY